MNLLQRWLGIEPEPCETVPEPRLYRERPACPFYGFHGSERLLVDARNDQCGLIRDRFEPCRMGMYERPSWHACSLRKAWPDRKLRDFLKIAQVVADEFQPKEPLYPRVLTGREWYDYVMRDRCPRPDDPP